MLTIYGDEGAPRVVVAQTDLDRGSLGPHEHFSTRPLYIHNSHILYLRNWGFIGMDVTAGEKFDLLVRTRDEDFKELLTRINQVNKQLNVRMDALIERFEELNEKINRLKT
jgi:hypothetical protein